jgi:hypothetical protein
MEFTSDLRKMRTSLDEQGVAQYILPLYDKTENVGTYFMNPLIGEKITIHFQQEIHCVETGKRIKKTFGEGLSYESWLKSPLASPSIIRPELSRIHEGIALRDMAWEQEHHNQPHIVYLSSTSGVKVGVTRATNKISRWIDQGATEGIVLAETPYRQLAGLIEVALKDHLPDKTAWQAMLKNENNASESLPSAKNRMLELLPQDYEPFFADSDEVTKISYPVTLYPLKVKSLKLDTFQQYSGELAGIKGQYLLFKDGHVLNIRAHAGYRIALEKVAS